MADYNFITDSGTPPIIRDFLSYMETVVGRSPKTVDQYFMDLRVFFRYIKKLRGLVECSNDLEFQKISIDDIDIEFVRSVSLSEIYSYMSYLMRDRGIVHKDVVTGKGLNAASRARKTVALRQFYNYLEIKTKQLEHNPMKELETPKTKKSLPKYLNTSESLSLLENVSGNNDIRDYAILTIFLNCGLRVAELIGINVNDIKPDKSILRVLGKGNKEREVSLNDACREALELWFEQRKTYPRAKTSPALFVTRQSDRITSDAVLKLVKKYIARAGLDPQRFSTHKLRHTAATLMYQNGVDVRTLQHILGHENLNTTEIYTHIADDQIRSATDRNPLAEVKPPKPRSQVLSDIREKLAEDAEVVSDNIPPQVETSEEGAETSEESTETSERDEDTKK